MAITCCEADMSFLGYLAHYDGIEALERFAHVAVEARMTYRYLRHYDDVAPYLEVLRLTEHRPPAGLCQRHFLRRACMESPI